MVDHAASPERLRRVGETLSQLDLRGLGPEADAVRRRAAVAAGEYLAPRLEHSSDRIVVAVVGPAGGGKSTIVNTLAHRHITDTGPVRPTTIEPVAWVKGDIPHTFDGVRARVAGSVVDTLRPPPEGSVVIDTPPPDVLDSDGVPVVRQVIDVADAIVFVAGAGRYADAAGFALLEVAAARRLPTVMVLNRLPGSPDHQQEIAADFASKLADHRLIPRPDPGMITTIPEAAVSDDTAGLDVSLVAAVGKDIEAMADPQSRPEIISGVVAATLARLRADLVEIRRFIVDVESKRFDLLDPVRAAYRREVRRLVSDIRRGRFADVPIEGIAEVLASAAARRSGIAAREAAEAWAEQEPDLVDAAPGLFGHSPATPEVARDRIGFWLQELGALPERAGVRGRRRRERLAACLARVVLAPEVRPDGRSGRLLERHPTLASTALDLLGDEIEGILATDSRRFEERVGRPIPASALTDLAGVSDG